MSYTYKRGLVWKCLDVACLVVIALPSVVLNSGVKPFRRGYFCDDLSITSLLADGSAMLRVLKLLDVVLPCVFVLCDKSIEHKKTGRGTLAAQSSTEYKCFLNKCYKMIVMYLFIVIGAESSIDLAKYTLGILRPDFVAVCQPDFLCEADSRYYVESYRCLSNDDSAVIEARLSFPSDYAAFACFSSFYVAFYLQMRMKRMSVVSVISLSLLCLSWARCHHLVLTNRNHAEDVIMGAVIGLIMALLARQLQLLPATRQRWALQRQSSSFFSNSTFSRLQAAQHTSHSCHNYFSIEKCNSCNE